MDKSPPVIAMLSWIRRFWSHWPQGSGAGSGLHWDARRLDLVVAATVPALGPAALPWTVLGGPKLQVG